MNYHSKVNNKYLRCSFFKTTSDISIILSFCLIAKQGEMARNKRRAKARDAIKLQLTNFDTRLERGARDEERAPTCSDADLKNFYVDPQDQALVGETWRDWEDNGAKFVLKSIEWSRVDSEDGKRIPVLIGLYEEVGNSANDHWSDMEEIREWIKDFVNENDTDDDDACTSEDSDIESDSAKVGNDEEICRQHEITHVRKASISKDRANKPANQVERMENTQRRPLSASQVKYKIVLTIALA